MTSEYSGRIQYISKTLVVPLCIKFMVSIGANPITSIGDEKQFPIGSKWLFIKRGKPYLRSKRIRLPLLQ